MSHSLVPSGSPGPGGTFHSRRKDRMARALSNEEFGRRIGVSASVASRIRAGKHQPSLEAIKAISAEFRVPITDLVLACLERDPETGDSKAQAEILAIAVPRRNEKASA